MANFTSIKPIAVGVGAAFVASALTVSNANAAPNPFATADITSGVLHAGAEGKCGEGRCGEGKDKEGKCGEGKCGGDKDGDSDSDSAGE